MMRRFRPTIRSFLGSALFSLMPAAVATLVNYFVGGKGGMAMKIGFIGMLALSGYMLLVDIFAHIVRLQVTPEGIIRLGPFGGGVGMRWQEIGEATLRERHNPATRTDRLLILQSKRGTFTYPISVLSREEEQIVIDEMNRRLRLVVVQDRPAI